VSGRTTVVFTSWSGRYSDSPRAISEELHRRGADVEHVWLLGDGAGPVPAHVRAVPAVGPEAEAALAAAPYIVSNDMLEHAFTKAPGARFLQTWHGTPLKRIAFDVARPAFAGARQVYDVFMPRDVARWDVLLSPNPFSTGVLARAFRYEGPVVETGYPRNDVLSSPERDAIRARVRAELGLEDGRRAVLYAPTWRDSYEFAYAADPERLARAAGDDVVLLVRAHGLVRERTERVAASDAVRDVSGHQDISELYLAADALMTDYSSAMFDFAITGKPIVLYVYDLEDYRDRMRGFYFDLEAEAPGPLLRTEDEVVAALADLGAVAARHADAHAAFRARYCALEDGGAAGRAIDVLFGD
jgi:CDP-glycerol glycerophosphotransferase